MKIIHKITVKFPQKNKKTCTKIYTKFYPKIYTKIYTKYTQKVTQKITLLLKNLCKSHKQWCFQCNSFFSTCTNFRLEIDDEIVFPDSMGI